MLPLPNHTIFAKGSTLMVFRFAGLCGLLALASCAASGSPPPVAAAAPAVASSQNAMPRVNKTSVAAGVMERFRPEMNEYLAEIQKDNDYSNWKAAPATAFAH